MSRPTAEALLISACLHNADLTEAGRYGVTPMHFRGYPQEFNWICGYEQTYATMPSIDAFLDQFPDFPLRDHHDVRYASDEVLQAYAKAKISENIAEAIAHLRIDDVSAASQMLTSYAYTPATAIPTDLVCSLDFLDDFATDVRGLHVPWRTLQEATDGIKPGNFWVWAARPGQGKSAFLSDIAVTTLTTGKRVLYYSLEMSAEEVRSRLHSNLATKFGYEGLTSMAIRRRTVDLREYKQFVNELPDRLGGGVLHVHTPADGPVSPAVVAARASEYDLVVIDYLTLMITDAGLHASEDWRTAAQISNRLKQIALASHTPVLSAAQINREGDGGDLPPRLKNLAQADSIGQDADVVVTMRNRKNAVAVCSLEKNRHGVSGKRWFTRFDVNQGRYEEIGEEKAEDLVIEAELRETR